MPITGAHLIKLSMIADGAGKTNFGIANIKTQASHTIKVEATINHGPNLFISFFILAFTFQHNFFTVEIILFIAVPKKCGFLTPPLKRQNLVCMYRSDF